MDFCAEREPFYFDASAIIDMGYKGKITGTQVVKWWQFIISLIWE